MDTQLSNYKLTSMFLSLAWYGHGDGLTLKGLEFKTKVIIYVFQSFDIDLIF